MPLQKSTNKKDEKVINEALLASTLICDMDEACLYYYQESNNNYKASYSWQKPNLFSGSYLPQDIASNQLFWCLNKLTKDEELFISKIGDLTDKAPSDLEILEDAKVGSFAMLPVICDSKLEAVLALYKYGSIKEWKEGEKSFLRMVASVFSLQITKNKAIKNYLNLKKEITAQKQSSLPQNITKTFENLPTAVIITDKNGFIEYVNPMFTKITGYELKEALGKKPSILKSGEIDEAVFQDLWQTITSGKNWQGEVLNKRKNGELFWQDSKISPIFDEDNNITHFIAINDDVSEVKELRNKLQKELKDKSEFIAFISHEIRTPLNGIYGLTTEMLETKLDDVQKDAVHTIVTSCNSLEQILSDVLDLSKIESNQMKLDNVMFDLKLLLDNIIKLMIPYANQKNIGLAINISKDVKRFFIGDPLRLRQVIVNIVNNAIKFTEKGGISIFVSNSGQNQNQQTLLFEFKDTGIGMLEEERVKIFKAFSQADASINSKYGGTGLGLSICNKLINLMSGEIGFETKPEKGSFFWFKVPLEESFKNPEEEDYHDSFINPPEPFVAPLNILLVEDNPINVKVAVSFLGRRGHNVTFVHNGEDAVEAVFANNFDIVLMDINMPIMDGFEATQRIRKLDGDKAKIPIIALTGDTSFGESEKYLAFGMDWYINKPIYIPELINVIARFSPKDKVENHNYSFNKSKKTYKKEHDWLDAAAITTLITEIDKTDIIHLFKDFFIYAEEQVAKIKTALSISEYETIRQLCHSFKSTSASIGLARFAELNAQIESECKKQNYKNAKNLCSELDEIYQKSISELIKQYLIFICKG